MTSGQTRTRLGERSSGKLVRLGQMEEVGLCLLPTIMLLGTWVGSRLLGQEPGLCLLCHSGSLRCAANFAFSVKGYEDPNLTIGPLLAPEAAEYRESRLPSTPFSSKDVKPLGTGHEVRDRRNISHIQAQTQ